MKTVIFFGANSDICKATIELLDTDRKIVLITRDKEKLPEHLQQQYECHSCDPCQHEQVNEHVQSISKKHSVDTVVNFCGSIILKPASSLTFKDWQHTIDRLGEPGDIARMVAWLSQPDNNWITGEVFRIDGGLSTTKLYP